MSTMMELAIDNARLSEQVAAFSRVICAIVHHQGGRLRVSGKLLESVPPCAALRGESQPDGGLEFSVMIIKDGQPPQEVQGEAVAMPQNAIVFPSLAALGGESLPKDSYAPAMKRPARHVLLFMNRFEAPIVGGTKIHTMRLRKRVPKVGDVLSLRVWTGKPYRSKQREILSATCTRVQEFRMEAMSPFVDGDFVWSDAERAALAKRDGFGFWEEMRETLHQMHGLYFVGHLIWWK